MTEGDRAGDRETRCFAGKASSIARDERAERLAGFIRAADWLPAVADRMCFGYGDQSFIYHVAQNLQEFSDGRFLIGILLVLILASALLCR